jgi:hypothetical protein
MPIGVFMGSKSKDTLGDERCAPGRQTVNFVIKPGTFHQQLSRSGKRDGAFFAATDGSHGLSSRLVRSLHLHEILTKYASKVL